MDGDRLLTQFLDEGVKEGLFTLVPPMGYFAKHLHMFHSKLLLQTMF